MGGILKKKTNAKGRRAMGFTANQQKKVPFGWKDPKSGAAQVRREKEHSEEEKSGGERIEKQLGGGGENDGAL